MSVISNIMMGIVEIINMTFMMWSFVMWCLVMEFVSNFMMDGDFMVLFVMERMLNMVFFVVSWMISFVAMLRSSHFMRNIVDPVWKVMIVMCVMFVINHMTLNHFVPIFMAIVSSKMKWC